MKLKIGLATVVGCMALAACGGGSSEDNTMNADANMMTDMNAGMTDLNTTDMNMTTDANAMGNMDMNAMGTTNTTNTTDTPTTNTDATNTTTNTL